MVTSGVMCTVLLLAARPRLEAGARAAAVEYARALPASSIEAGLPAVRLDGWLQRTVGARRLEWFISDCDLKPEGLPAKQELLCVGARVAAGDPIYLRFHLAVGNLEDGVSGKPHVLPQSFTSCNVPGTRSVDSMVQIESLSTLREAVGRLRKRCSVQR